MTDKIIVLLIGAFIAIIGIVFIVNPKIGFDFNHPMKKRVPTERDLRMAVVSGVVGVVFGVLVIVGSLLYL